jgi:hypothetical protein
MINVTVDGASYSLDENEVTYIAPNGTGSDIYTETNRFENVVNCSETPTQVIALSPILYALTNTENTKVVITIGYSGSNIGWNFSIGTGQYQKLSDNGSNSLTCVALLPALIAVGQGIKSSTGNGAVTSVSYSVPANPLNINLRRITNVVPSYYNGSLITYNDSGAKPTDYHVSLTVAQVQALINAVNPTSGLQLYQIQLNNNGTNTYTDADIDFSAPAGLTSFVGGNLIVASADGVGINDQVTSPVLPAVIGSSIVFSGAPAGNLTLLISIVT